MPGPHAPPIRKGKAVVLTLDVDALQLLRQLTPSKMRLGNVVSELIRGEITRREERQKTIRELLASAEGGQTP